MLETYLITHPIAIASLWFVLYTCDYYLTLWGSKLFRAQRFILYEGSYEMTPEYQDDIDSMRKLSPHFVVWLLIGTAVLLAPLLPCPDVIIVQTLYAILIGAMIVPEFVALTKHTENIIFWRILGSKSPGVTGSVCYSHAISYRRSALNTSCVGLVLLMAAALGDSFILLGGGLLMLVMSFTHYQLARQMMAMQEAAAAADSEPQSAGAASSEANK